MTKPEHNSPHILALLSCHFQHEVLGTLRALFLETPPALTLMLTGVTLLAISTALILARYRLQIAWKQWE